MKRRVLLASDGEDLLELQRRRLERERRGELHVGRLAHAHLLEQPQLLDARLVRRLEERCFLLADGQLGATHVERGDGARGGARLREGELRLRGGEEGVLQCGPCALLQHVQVLLRDGRAETLGRTGDGGICGAHVGALQLGRDGGGSAVLRLHRQVIRGRDLVRCGAEALAGDELLQSLAVLRPELRRHVRQEGAVGAAELCVRHVAVLDRREVLRIVLPGDGDGLLHRERREGRRGDDGSRLRRSELRDGGDGEVL